MFNFIKLLFKDQYEGEATKAQTVFDVCFGIVLPALCFYADPTVFQGSDYGAPEFSDLKAFAYLFSFASMIVLVLWLCFKKRFGRLNVVIAGMFFTAANFCLAIGLMLLSLSLIGLLLVIGVLGFTPFLTGFVYLRSGLRARTLARTEMRPAWFVGAIILSAALSFVVPAVLNYKINRAVSEMTEGDAQTIQASAERLKVVAFFADLDQVVGAFNATKDEEKRTALTIAYKSLTGGDIRQRSQYLASFGN